MGFLAAKLSQLFGTGHIDALKTALRNGDAETAVSAINQAVPRETPGEDPVVEILREYGGQEGHDPDLLCTLREALYSHYDRKISIIPDFCENVVDDKEIGGYRHPLHIYGLAAYTNDVAKIRALGKQGIKPDSVSNYGGLKESIVLGLARQGAFDAMKEVIYQGASLNKAYGWDEFPPLHAFSKPLFHAFHPGVTKALLETGKPEIIEAVNKACGPEFTAKQGKGPDLKP